MTLALDALEDAVLLIQKARRSIRWIDHENPVWLTLHHAERYVAQQFKAEFNFITNNEERGNDEQDN